MSVDREKLAGAGWGGEAAAAAAQTRVGGAEADAARVITFTFESSNTCVHLYICTAKDDERNRRKGNRGGGGRLCACWASLAPSSAIHLNNINKTTEGEREKEPIGTKEGPAAGFSLVFCFPSSENLARPKARARRGALLVSSRLLTREAPPALPVKPLRRPPIHHQSNRSIASCLLLSIISGLSGSGSKQTGSEPAATLSRAAQTYFSHSYRTDKSHHRISLQTIKTPIDYHQTQAPLVYTACSSICKAPSTPCSLC